MIYDVRLRIAYDYPSSVKDARHVLRVRPREGFAGQSVLSRTLDIAPRPDERSLDRDFFGNEVDHVVLLDAHSRFGVDMHARVETAPASADLDETPARAAVAAAARLSREAGALAPMHFLGPSRYAPASEAAAAYAEKGLAPALSLGRAVLALTKAIRQDFVYTPGSTTISTPVDTVLTTRRGVCQDFSHVMIAGLRGAGIPAAYVSGFIRTLPPPGRPRLEGADAMHAWVAAWLGEAAGWVGFDPTNGVVASEDHIVVALGRDYADIAPVGGVVLTSGSQATSHAVDVVPVDEPPVAEPAALVGK